MKTIPAILLLFAVLSGQAADQRGEFEAGRACYQEGNFKKAVVHFRLALKVDPNDPKLNYWAGRAYQGLGDVAMPFPGRSKSKALLHLAKAVDLAPSVSDYRRELFDFLLDSARSSPGALQLASDVLQRTPRFDPEYDFMCERLERESRMAWSRGARFDRLLLAIPRAAFQIIPER
jgi:tetratricopeptide (TPR) repeat protein